MAKKIDITSMTHNFNKKQKEILKLLNIFLSNDNEDSSASMDNTQADVVKAFLPLFIITAYSFYDKASNEGLSSEVLQELSDYKTYSIQTFFKANANEHKTSMSMSLLNKIPLDLSVVDKKGLEASKWVDYDDDYPLHYHAFKLENEGTKFPDKNILVRINISGQLYLRVGIKIIKTDGKTELRIMDIAHKKTK